MNTLKHDKTVLHVMNEIVEDLIEKFHARLKSFEYI
jgi:hypothetical protein